MIDQTGRAARSMPGWTWDLLASRGKPMRCERLEELPDVPPFGADTMARLGLSGIQFGSGEMLQAACLNTDLAAFTDGTALTERGRLYVVDGRHFLQVDARETIAIAPASFQWAYSEHFIEHLTLAEAVFWLKQVRRVLAPRGLLRVSTPDLRRYVDGYLAEDDEFFRSHRERLQLFGVPDMGRRRAFMLNQIFQFWGHRWIYDAEELCHVLGEAGFDLATFTVCAYRQGREPAIAGLDLESRNDESVYVEVMA
jgi:predicted SAM-dependent methyltransferase